MSGAEGHFDEYEHYNYDQEKYLHGRSGKQRTKKEASEHTNHHDPSGHVRKIVTKMANTEQNQKATRKDQQQKDAKTKGSEEETLTPKERKRKDSQEADQE